MHANPKTTLEVMQKYAAGYFPMYDSDDAQAQKFYWDRWPVRGIIPLTDDTLARARRLSKRAEKEPFEIRYTTAVEEVIAQLGKVKEHSWVRGQVVDIYRTLHAARLLQTVEVWSGAQLVGALLGIVLPGIFVAETMYGLVPEASKICLCQLVQDCAAAGFTLIDVQTPHTPETTRAQASATAHPCMRLGEICISLEDFLATIHATWARNFGGDLQSWLDLARLKPCKISSSDDPRRFLLRT